MTRKTLVSSAFAAILAVQALVSHVLHRNPYLPAPQPLTNFPLHLGNWNLLAEEAVLPEALETLGPDDHLARVYQASGGMEQADVFVAYYRTQLRSKNAHDPKVCLPGSGWNPMESRVTRVSMAGRDASFPANYYRIRKGENEQVVLYWFQTPKGIYTFEQQLKAHRVLDAIVDNRTDMALVRIIVPVTRTGLAAADASVMRVAGLVYTSMLPYFPPTGKVKS